MTDAAGNLSAPSEALLVNIDLTAPTAKVEAMSDDTGKSATDRLTSDREPSFTFSRNEAALIEVEVIDAHGQVVASGSLPAGTGNVVYTPSAPLPDGAYTLSFIATDLASNSRPGTSAFTIDTSAPGVATMDLVEASDTGLSATDNITRDSTPTFTGIAEPGATVRIYDGPTLRGTVTADATTGAWGGTISLPNGLHSLTTTVTDAAGNVSAPSEALLLTIDTAAPTAKVEAMSVDTGKSATDRLTSDRAPSFTLSRNEAASLEVTVRDAQGEVVASGSFPAGTENVVFTPGAPLADGAFTLAFVATDLAGNSRSGTSSFTIDATAPAATTPDLIDSSDTGVSATDHITKDTTPTFTGTAEVGSTVALYDGDVLLKSTTASSTGLWTITTGTLPEGLHAFTTTVTDAAGNVTRSEILPVTIDTTKPGVSAPDLAEASDAGSSAADNLTSIAMPTFTGTAEAGSTVVLYVASSTQIGSAVADESGAWEITASSPLADGTHSITTIVTDVAGNSSSCSATLSVKIDTAKPAVSAPDLVAAADTGVSDTDNITRNTTPSFSGTAEKGSTVTLYDGGQAIGTATAHATTGAWTITAAPLSQGTHSLTTTATDAAGNVSDPSAALEVTIDTSAPVLKVLSMSADTGEPNDRITADTTPSFRLYPQETSSLVISLTDGQGQVVFTQTLAEATGAFTYNLPEGVLPLADGGYTLSVLPTDLAGNTRGAPVTYAFTIDTTAPGLSAPDLAAASDSGMLSTDKLTKIATPTLTGSAEAGSTVTLYDGTAEIGTTVAEADGSWSFTTPTLADGNHAITTTVTDAAGNTSLASAPLAIAIDTAAPTLALTVDDALLNGHETALITLVASEVILLAPDAITVTGGTLGPLSTTDGITYTAVFNPEAGLEGEATISIAAGGYADPAGNAGAAAGISLAVDTVTPEAPAILGAATDTDRPADFVTSDRSLIFYGTAEAGALIALSLGGVAIGTTTAGADGLWSHDHTGEELPLGDITLSATATDAAGNVSEATSQLLRIFPGAVQISGVSSWGGHYEGGLGNDVIEVTGGYNTVTTGYGEDRIVTAGYGNVIDAGEGDDVIDAGDGYATVDAGAGANQVTVRGYFNTVTAGTGPLTVVGPAGHTSVTSAGGSTDLALAGWNNTIVVDHGGGAVVASGGGNDLICLSGWNNTVDAGAGYDVIFSGDGGDTFVLDLPGQGVDTIVGFDSWMGDKLRLQGVAAEALAATTNGNDLVLTAHGVEVAVLMDRGSQTLDELMQSGSLIFA